jgi:hypothetical protein
MSLESNRTRNNAKEKREAPHMKGNRHEKQSGSRDFKASRYSSSNGNGCARPV